MYMVDSVIETTKENSSNIGEEYEVIIENMSRRERRSNSQNRRIRNISIQQ